MPLALPNLARFKLARPNQVLQNFTDLRRHSLLRGNLLVLGSLLVAIKISGFSAATPLLRATSWQLLPMLCGIVGMAETARCIRPRWGMYHAAVLLFLYTDLMVMTLLAILLVYPLWVR